MAASNDPRLITLLDRLRDRGLTTTGRNAWKARCPAHDDDDPSLSIRLAGDRVLLHCFANCPTEDIMAALGLQMRDLFLGSSDGRASSPGREVAVYDYRDENGTRLYQVVRYDPKAFRQRRPDGKGGWTWRLGDVRRVLYRLPELLAAPTGAPVFIVEGEKDAERLASLGLVSTCSPGGAGKWRPERYAETLRGRRVVVIPDQDTAGERHADMVARSLQGVATSVHLLHLPDLVDKGDVSVWLDAGGTAADLARLAAEAPVWGADAEPEPHLEPTDPPVPGEVRDRESFRDRVVNGADLCRQELAPRRSLPLLGHEGYIIRGWATLVAGYPKSGKTELLARLCMEWDGERVLYLTEEAEEIWQERLLAVAPPERWAHLDLVYALGLEPEELLTGVLESEATVVIIDTVRNLLRIHDENDNSEVARRLAPYIRACRDHGQTLIMAHHIRKGGGDYGEGITGAHAFLGIVDAALEIWRDANLSDTRRKIKRYGRLKAAGDLVYELCDDGSMRALGDPALLRIEAVKARVYENLSNEWATVTEVLNFMGDPSPSRKQVYNALEMLWREGSVDRDPEAPKAGATYRYRIMQGEPRSHDMTSNRDASPERFLLPPVREEIGPPDEAAYTVYVEGCRFVGAQPLPIDAWWQQKHAVDALVRAEQALQNGHET